MKLVHEANGPVTQGAPRVLAQLVYVLTVDQDVSRSRPIKAPENLQQRGLA